MFIKQRKMLMTETEYVSVLEPEQGYCQQYLFFCLKYEPSNKLIKNGLLTSFLQHSVLGSIQYFNI